MTILSVEEARVLSRAAVLFHSERSTLSTFEAELVEACTERYRRLGAKAVLTAHEWQGVRDALEAMEASRASALAADANARAAMKGI